MESGYILIDKPSGVTSFDCIRRLRTVLPGVKMGHAGTLDPAATGLMIIALGRSTKRLSELLGLPKSYEAFVRLGVATDTGDADGRIIESGDAGKVTADDIRRELRGMQGILELPVPAYSAVKRGGEPLYAKARRGEVVDVPVKTMGVTEARLISKDEDIAHIIFSVTSGTYVRSLAEELGRRLSLPASLVGLRRTAIGSYSISQAIPLAAATVADIVKELEIPSSSMHTTLSGFKQFILRGNVVDLAVGVVIGAAFGTLVNSLVSDLLTPLIAAVAKAPDFSSLSWTLNGSQLMYGNFLNAFISFMIVAASIYFFVVTPVTALLSRMKKEEAALPPKEDAEEVRLLREIRDALKQRSN
jgi:tRNA pseudouridine55 synthase